MVWWVGNTSFLQKLWLTNLKKIMEKVVYAYQHAFVEDIKILDIASL